MQVIKYLKTKMRISKPYLFLLSVIIAFMLGIFVMQIPFYFSRQASRVSLEKQTSLTIDLEKKLIKQELEWEKKLKKATKTITLRKPDGTEEIIETTQEESQEAGKMVIDTQTLSKRLQLMETEIKTEVLPNWSLSLGAIPLSMDLGSYNNYSFSFQVERRIIGNFYTGPMVIFNDGKWFIGLSATYQF